MRRPDEDARVEAERLRQAVAALERVRTQLARTQRTLDAFVAQITGAPDGAAMRAPVPTPSAGLAEPVASPPAPAPAAPSDPSHVLPPGPLAEHVLPAPELQPPPPPRIEPAPLAPTVEAATPVDVERPVPPAPIAAHVTPPGERIPGPDGEPFVDPDVATAAAGADATPGPADATAATMPDPALDGSRERRGLPASSAPPARDDAPSTPA